MNKTFKRIAATALAAVSLAATMATSASAFTITDAMYNDYIPSPTGVSQTFEINKSNMNAFGVLTESFLEKHVSDNDWSYTYLYLDYNAQRAEDLFIFDKGIDLYEAYDYAKKLVVYDYDENILNTELRYNNAIGRYVLVVSNNYKDLNKYTWNYITFRTEATSSRLYDVNKTANKTVGNVRYTRGYVIDGNKAYAKIAFCDTCVPLLNVYDNRNGDLYDVYLDQQADGTIDMYWVTNRASTGSYVTESGSKYTTAAFAGFGSALGTKSVGYRCGWINTPSYTG